MSYLISSFVRPYLVCLPIGLSIISVPLVARTVEEVDTVIVTATRTAQTANEAVSTVKVIGHEEIIRSQAKTLPDLLRGLTGIHFGNSGGRGKATSLFLRGTNSDHVLVMIDGVKVGSATSGTTPFQDLPLAQIDRIELVSGPRSSLYGSEALGGVIQIFTRKGGGEFKPNLSFSAGSDDTYEASAGLSGGGKKTFFSGTVSGTTTQGFNSCRAEAATEFGGCFIDQPDKDAYDSLAASLRAGMQFDNGSEVALSGMLSDNESEFDGGFQDNSKTAQSLVSVNSNWYLSDRWWLKIVAGRSEDDADSYLNEVFATTFNTTRDTLTMQHDWLLSSTDTLTFGLDYQRDEIDTDGDQNFDGLVDDTDQFDKTERENRGVFAQYLTQSGQHDLELSLRHDENEQFGDHVTGGVGYGFALAKELRFISSYGTAFKAPSFNQLYYPGFGVASLKPEESSSFEFGLRGKHTDSQWSVIYFNTHIEELIGFDSAWTQTNIDEAKIRGFEITVDQTVMDHWLLGLDLSLISPRNESAGANESNILARRPERSGRFDFDYLAGSWSAGASVLFAGTRYDDQANTRKLAAYKTVDLRAQLEIAEDWLVQTSIENLFNSNYETAAYFNQPDRAVYLTLRYLP